MTLRVGIAGFGLVGRLRRACIDARPDMEVVAASDVAFDGSDDQLDLQCGRFLSVETMIVDANLDALFVCLPNHLAAATAIQGLEAGLHVFCEKPPARTALELKRVLEVEQRHPDSRLMYGFNHRYHDSVMEAIRIIRSEELGAVVDLRGIYGKSAILRYEPGEWRSLRRFAGGGILLDQGIHMVDMMRLFAGEFTEVHSYISNAYWQHDVEDNAYVLMRTDAGVVAMMQSSATQWRHRFQLDITLERGAIQLAGLLTSSKSYGAEMITVVTPTSDAAGDPHEVTTRFNGDPSWVREVAAFADAIATGRPVYEGSSLDALKTMELIERIYVADPVWSSRYPPDQRDELESR